MALILLSVAAVLSITVAHADDDATTFIGGGAFGGMTGAMAVNQSAGDSNHQFNGAAVVASESRAAVATVVALQHLDPGSAGEPDSAAARIGGNAFAAAQGLIAVNQASGHQNIQANAVAIAIGVEGFTVAETVLSQTRSDAAFPPDEPMEREGGRAASVGNGAFHDAQGIVQVNQSAGVANNAANSFALRFSAQANP